MPGADVAVTEDKLIAAANSLDQDVYLKNKDKMNDLGMTQGESPGGDGTHNAVSQQSDSDIDTTLGKMAEHSDSKNQSPGLKPNEEDVVCIVPPEGKGSTLLLPMGNVSKSSEVEISSMAKPNECTDDDSACARIEVSNKNGKDEAESGKLNQHQILSTSARTFAGRKHECEKCGVSFHGRETYEVHVKQYCSGKKYAITCKACGAKFDNNKRLMLHMNAHAPRNICLLCNERISDVDCENHVIFHVDVAEEKIGGQMCCPGCESSFIDKAELSSHFYMHHTIHPPFPAQPYTTDNCVNKCHPTDKNDWLISSPNFSESGLCPSSSQGKTSTPFRPALSMEADGGKMGIFSCIVCGIGYHDVIALQRHLLTAHTTLEAKRIQTSSTQEDGNCDNRSRSTSRHNLRKVSTVSPPQLSLLASSLSGKTTESSKEADICHLKIMCAKENISILPAYNKKRKERIIIESEREDFATTKQETLKRIRREKEYATPKGVDGKKLENAITGIRRVSCPTVSMSVTDPGELQNTSSTIRSQTDVNRYCVQCDIKFSSSGNFRAHKQFYCASRHAQRLRDTVQSDQCEGPEYRNGCHSEHDGLYMQSRKRNIGNKSSMTPRKRSHLTPLETVRGSSPIDEDGETTKSISVRKSCPSHLATMTVSTRTSPSGNSSPIGVPNLPKKHLCQECNIWFSKHDTYIAHKKYYCESRRKDKGGIRALQASTRTLSNSRSETTNREHLFQSDNPLSLPDRSCPSTETEEERRISRKNSEYGNKFQSSISSPYRAQFPFYGQADQVMLARMSLMQPLILNQYLAMLRERMGQGMQDNGVLFQTPTFVGFPGTANNFLTARPRKLSADEVLGTLEEDGQGGLRKNARPNRQSCVAVINVKRETEKDEDEAVSRTPSSNVAPDPRVPSPLDLSSKVCKEANATGDTLISRGQAIFVKNSTFPTIDLSTTVLPIIKREPEVELPADNTHGHEQPEPEEGTELKQTSPIPATGVYNQQEIQSPQVKHCKNCDARFTSLSTFIAHKKYYCTSSSVGGLVRSEVKHVQLAH